MSSLHSTSSVAELLKAKPRPQTWTTQDVRMWLESIGMDVYAPIFEAAGVAGADLINCDADALKLRLGVASLGHRTQLMQQIAILSARAAMGLKRAAERSGPGKRKELLESLYPDKVRRETKAAMDEKLVEAREMYWTPDDRKERGALEQAKATKPAGARGRPSSAHVGGEHDLFIAEGQAPVQVQVHRPPVTTIPSRRRVVSGTRAQGTRKPPPPQATETLSEDELGVVEDEEELLSPLERMQQVSDTIKVLEQSGNLEGLVKAWVEYGACVRMEHGDAHPLLVRTHFNLATAYLRQKLVHQALSHFRDADAINAHVGLRDAEGQSFHCRILEGMGICETRLGHFASAQALLDKAKKLCSNSAGAHRDGGEEGEGEEDGQEVYSSAAASVLVALSELHSAQGKYTEAIDCLTQAWVSKENELGPQHVQVGKLFSAMGTIKQKHLKDLVQQLSDVEMTLQSSVRVKQQIDDKIEGLNFQSEQEERGVEQLVRDIAHYRERQQELEQSVRECKGDALDYLNRARKIISEAKGNDHPDAVALTKTVSLLASRFAEEEKEAIRARKLEEDALQHNNKSPQRKAAEQATQDWLRKQGLSLEEWGMEGHAEMSDVDSLITVLRERPAASAQHE